jgi:hypothetical protein
LKRCVVCDYAEETGRDFTGAKVGHRQIVFNRRFKEHLCSACYNSLKQSKTEFWYYDLARGKVEPTSNKPDIDKNVEDTIFEVPTSLPPLLVE